jgi:Flp pilus assembly protein TadG
MFSPVTMRCADVLRHLAAERKGSVVLMFAVTMFSVFVAAGAAVDYSRASTVRTELQKAIDAAVLAGARDNSDSRDSTAQTWFTVNLRRADSATVTVKFTMLENNVYTGTASTSVPTTLAKVTSMGSIAVSVKASALANSYPLCLMALNPTASGALQVLGSSGLTAPECTVQVNSNATGAVETTGNGYIKSAANCFVGSAKTTTNTSISPPPAASCSPKPDPFANYPLPVVGQCNYTNTKITGQAAVTLNPGVYCGGISIVGQAEVTFAPGFYVIKDGTLSASGGGKLTGDGVTFFLTGNGAGVDLGGVTTTHFTAASTGPFPGFVFFLDPSAAAAKSSQVSGTAELFFEGIVYLPSQPLTVTGSSGVFAPSPFTMYIADTIKVAGNAMVVKSDPKKTNVALPTAMLGDQPYLTH